MARISRSVLVPAVVACCAVLVAGRIVGPVAEAQPGRADKPEPPSQDVSVLVEAFVVEVRLSALYELGVSPIGKKPNSVSVDNILECLGGKDLAEVTTGVKVAVHPKTSGTTKLTETIYVERQTTHTGSGKSRTPVTSTSYDAHDIGWQFRCVASVRPNGSILVDFEFGQSTYKNIDSAGQAPPDTANRDFSGAAYLDAGEPEIVGAVQNEETAVFLVLCAAVKD